MSIQQSINQGIAIAGALHTQTEAFKTKQELKGISKNIKSAEETEAALKSTVSNQPSSNKLIKELSETNQSYLQSLLEQQYKLSPTLENFEKLRKLPYQMTAADKANLMSDMQRKTKLTQKELFTKYMKENYSQWQNRG